MNEYFRYLVGLLARGIDFVSQDNRTDIREHNHCPEHDSNHTGPCIVCDRLLLPSLSVL
jgi:hypothetical protein